MQTQHKGRLAAAALLMGLAGAAQAHTGHGTHSLMEGLAHPFGLDHLLAMLAVGVWSVSALPQGKAWWGPATFLLALVASAALGAAGVTRISAIGSMSMPEAGWHHDGRFNLLDLVRMTEIEQSAELAAQPLAPYAD